MVRSLFIFVLLLFDLVYSDVNEKIYFILNTQHYNLAYFIDEKRINNTDIVSLGVKSSDGIFEVKSFLIKDNKILAKISGFPVKITDKFIYFYNTYSFFRYSIKEKEIKKQKKLNTDFFKRIHKENLIIIDDKYVYLKKNSLNVKSGNKTTVINLNIPSYHTLTVLDFYYCNGRLLGVFPLIDGKTIYALIDLHKYVVLKYMTLSKDNMTAFYACVDDKLLVYKKGLKFLDWEGRFYNLPLYEVK